MSALRAVIWVVVTILALVVIRDAYYASLDHAKTLLLGVGAGAFLGVLLVLEFPEILHDPKKPQIDP